jgi:hypothetical protein
MTYQLPGSKATPDVESPQPETGSPQPTPTPLSVLPATKHRRRPSAILVATIRRTFNPFPEPRPHYPRRERDYFQAARMSRAMGRL